MPIPTKPCDAYFDDTIIAALQANRNRERWSSLSCARCGQQIGAVIEKGKWVPETHWPSVRYTPRPQRASSRYTTVAQSVAVKQS